MIFRFVPVQSPASLAEHSFDGVFDQVVTVPLMHLHPQEFILSNKCPIHFWAMRSLFVPLKGSQRGKYAMVQEAVEGVPQRGTLLRRAHELLESLGRPTAEDLLIQH